MRRRGDTATGHSKKRRGAPSSADVVEEGNDQGGRNCPVCFEPFNLSGTGPRTIVHSFACNGGEGMRHALCRSCDRRMYNAHGDACPICRAPRLGSSIAESGWRPPQERDTEFAPMFGPMLTSGGTIFFPVDDGDASVPVVEVRRIEIGRDGRPVSSNASASTIINDVLGDPVVQAAIEGLRNPGAITVRTFMANVGEARRARRISAISASAPPAPASVHDAQALAESYGYM